MSKKYTTNFLQDTNAETGSTNQVLVSTATGIDWVAGSGSGIIGGPYLPLTAGSSYPLTGNLYLDGSNQVYFVAQAGESNTEAMRITRSSDKMYFTYGVNAGDEAFYFDSSGDVTFEERIVVLGGLAANTAASSINAYSRTVATNLYSALRVIDNTSASSYWDIGATGSASTLLNFYHNGTTTPKISFTHTGDATFAGDITVTGGTLTLGADVSIFRDGVNILRTDDAFHANNDIYIGGAGRIYDRSNNATFIQLAHPNMTFTTPSGTATFTGEVEINKGGSTAAHADTDLLVQHSSAASTTAQVQILSGNTGYSNLYLSDTDTYNVAGWIYNHTNNSLTTRVNSQERMFIGGGRNSAYVGDGVWGATATPNWLIDSSGGYKFLLGYQDNGSGLYAPCYAFETKSTDGLSNTSEKPAIILKNTNSGYWVSTISNLGAIKATNSITIYGASDASIGALTVLGGNNLTISGIQTDHAGLSFATNAILPATEGATNTNTVDLGASSEKFKDFYLGGDASIAGHISMTDSILIDYTGSDGQGIDAGVKVLNDASDWGMYIRKDSDANHGMRIDSGGADAFNIYSTTGGSIKSFGVHGGTGATTISGTESLLLTLNPTANSHGGILFKYAGTTKGASIYNSNYMVYGGEAGVGTRLQSAGQYFLECDTSGNATFEGDLEIVGDFTAGGASPNQTLEFDTNSNNPELILKNNTATSSTSGTATLQFKQALNSTGGKIVSGRDSNYADGASRDSHLQFFTSTNASDTEKMRITSDGYVGINNTTPTFNLDIVGTARVTGNTEFVTQSTTDDSTKAATTAFVKNILAEQPAGLTFLGDWNASTNSPTLVSGGGELASGTTTSAATNKLIDSSATFVTDGVAANDRVRVVQTNGNIEFVVITAVDSETSLSLTGGAAAIVTGETYIVEGTPFLSPEGGYYIVSTTGTTNLNGITDWTAGDWTLIATTNVFQKIDNTSILSGSGAETKVAQWATSSGDPSVTLASGPITFSGDDSTFAGTITSGNILPISDAAYVIGGGTSTLRWNYLYLNNTLSITDGNINAGSAFDFNQGADFAGDLNISGGTFALITKSTNSADGSNVGFVRFDGTHTASSTIYTGPSINGIKEDASYATALTFKTTNSVGTVAEIMRIDADGNVGIGTHTPVRELHIKGPDNAVIRLESVANSDATDVEFYYGSTRMATIGSSSASGIMSIYTDSELTNGFRIGTNSIERMRIDFAGNVGIGVTPNAWYSAYRVLELNTGGAIYGTTTGVTLAQNLYFNTSAAWTTRNTTAGGLAVNDGGVFIWYTNPATSAGAAAALYERMRITNDGDVGIGTATPDARLEVRSTTTEKYVKFRADNGEERFAFFVGASGNAPSLYMYDNDGTTNNIKLSAGGDSFILNEVGIGTTAPSQALEVHSTIKIGETGVTAGKLISGDSMVFQIDSDGSGSSSSYRFRKDGTADDGTELMRIQEDGNVGIGTNDPQELLDVDTENIGLNVGNTAAVFGRAVGTTQSRDTWIKLRASAATTDYTWAFGTQQSGEFRFNYLGTRATVPTSGTNLLKIGNTGNATFAGLLYLPDGGVSAPSISNTGDTNTGMYWPGDHQLGFAVDGSRKFYMSTTKAYFQNLSSGVEISAGGIDVTGNSSISAAGTGNSPILHVTDTADTEVAWFTGNRLADTGAYIAIRHLPSTAAESNRTGIKFQAYDDGDVVTTYAQINQYIDDYTGGTEDGALAFSVIKDSSLAEIMRINTGGATFTGSIGTTGDMVLKSDSISCLTMWDSGGVGLAKFHGTLKIPDKLEHDGDDNTYLSFSAADNIKLVTGGTTALHAHDNGSVYLYTSGTQRLATVGASITNLSGGIEVTSTISGDDLTIELDHDTDNRSGTVINIGQGSYTAGKIYANNEGWEEADAGDPNATFMLGLCVGVALNEYRLLLNGIYDTGGHHGFTIGSPLYISTTSGNFTATAPSGGDYARVVGYAMSISNIYFCPDNTWVLTD